MSRLRFKVAISLDGYVAGPRQSVENPVGVGDDLHGLELVRTVATPNVTHLKYARR